MHFCPTDGVIIGMKCGFMGEFAKRQRKVHRLDRRNPN